MSNGPVDAYERQRAIRRRHLLERQALIFGGLIAALLTLLVAGLAVWFGAVPPPVSVPFESPTPVDTTVAPPCPPTDARPVPYNEITLNVYNGTTRGGLAAATAGELAARGFQIAARANDPFGRYDGAVLVRAGPAGLDEAYTVAALFPEAVVQLDIREEPTVDVTLGSRYEEMLPAQEAELDPGQPIPAPPGCYDVPLPPADAPAEA